MDTPLLTTYWPPHARRAYLYFCGTDGTNWASDPASTETIQGCRHRKVRSSTTPLRRSRRLDSVVDVFLEICRLPVIRPLLPVR